MVKSTLPYLAIALFLFVTISYSADDFFVIPVKSSRGLTDKDFYIVTNSIAVSSSVSYPNTYALCNPQDMVTGGGFEMMGAFDDQKKVQITDSYPFSDFTGWCVGGINNGVATNVTLYVWAICAKTSE